MIEALIKQINNTHDRVALVWGLFLLFVIGPSIILAVIGGLIIAIIHAFVN